MANKNDKKNIKDERIEDTTKYGEFIASFDQWTTYERLKKNAEYLEEITKEPAPDLDKEKKDKKRSD